MLEAIVREGWDLEGRRGSGLGARCRSRPVEVEVREEEGAAEGDRRWRVAYEAARSSRAGGAAATPQRGRPRGAAPAAAAGGAAGPRPDRREGKATQQVYRPAERIHLGRLAEVLDADGRVQRRNDVAFQEEGEVN